MTSGRGPQTHTGHGDSLDLRVRKLQPGDAQRCAELEEQLFVGDSPWPARAFQSEFDQPHNLYIGVDTPRDPDQDAAATVKPAARLLVGYAGLSLRGPSDGLECEIHTIGVDPAFQRCGIAQMMMDNFCQVADRSTAPIFLEVRTDNDPAIALYQRYGFDHLGIRRHYYAHGVDAYTMKRPPRVDSADSTPTVGK